MSQQNTVDANQAGQPGEQEEPVLTGVLAVPVGAGFLLLVAGGAFADAMAEHQRRVGQVAGPALSHCEDCGEPIPAERRAAVAGCRRCIDCQMLREKQKTGGHHGR